MTLLRIILFSKFINPRLIEEFGFNLFVKRISIFIFLFGSTIGISAQYLPGYNYYKKLTIQSSKVSDDLTDFPVLIQHTDPELRHTSSSGDVENLNGYDISFTAADKVTLLDHQIESYDPTTGAITMWVRIPFLDKNIDTDIYLYYGNSAVVADPSTTTVWDTNFQGVWHMNETGTGTRFDGTGNIDGTPTNYDNNEAVIGFIGGADDLEAASSDYISIGGDGAVLDVVSDLTVSAWVRINSLTGVQSPIIGKGDTQYMLRVNNVNNYTFFTYDGTWHESSSNANATAGQWKYIVGRVLGTEVSIWVDGIKQTDTETGGITSNSFDVEIGRNSEFTSRLFDGSIDEARVANVGRSDDWILTEYNSQSDPYGLPSSFYTMSAAMTPAPDWCWSQGVLANGEEVFLDVETDHASGHSYAVGYFNDDLSAEFPTGVNNTPNMSTLLGNQDGLVAKFDETGAPLWAFKIGASSETVEIKAVEIGKNGEIYITGYFEDRCQFAGVAGSPSSLLDAFSQGGDKKEAFIASYDSDGNLRWVKQGSNIDDAIGVDIAVNGTLVFGIGTFENSMTFTGGPTVASNDLIDTYTVAYDQATGAFVWFQKAGDITGTNANDRGYAIAADDNNVYITGTSSRTIEFNGGPWQVVAATAGQRNIFVAELDPLTGLATWAGGIGGNSGCEAHALTLDANNLYIGGGVEGNVSFFGGGSFLIPGGGEELFISALDRLSHTSVWEEVMDNDDGADMRVLDLIVTNGFVYGAGPFRGDTYFNNGGDTKISAGAEDCFVTKLSTSGAYEWTQVGADNNALYANGLGYDNDGGIVVVGLMNNEGTFLPNPSLGDDGGNDAFIAKLTCTSPCPGPSITTCPSDATVNSGPTCLYTLGDYIPSTVGSDDCGTGSLTITQSPPLGTSLTAGVHTIEMTAQDGNSNTATCSFQLTVEATVNPIVVECGDSYTGVSTSLDDNTQDSWTCSGVSTPGTDVYYQITVPTGNYLLGISMDNVSDANDTRIETFWMGAGCPNTTTCLEHNDFDIASQTFPNTGQNQLLFNAVGPGTYWFVVDSRTVDGVDNYDISFNCIVSGVEFDEDNCSPNDTDLDGNVVTVDGSFTLDVQPCETYTICDTLFIQNVNGGEWFDTVYYDLGPCWTNVTALVPDAPGANGIKDLLGTWDGTYNSGTNQIVWGFDNSAGFDWGDGLFPQSNYNCLAYPFCFTADLTSTCASSSDLNIEVRIEDDGVDGIIPGVSNGFDYATLDDFNLVTPAAPTFIYASTSYCTTGTDPSPTVNPTGGTFSAPVALGLNTSTGVIDLSGTTPGAYTVTYTEPSACANIVTFDVTVNNAAVPPVADLASLPNLTGSCSVAAPTAPTATDNCDGAITGTTTTSFPVTTQGTTVVTWTYTDGGGNSSTQNQNVIVDDVTAPVADAGSLADLTGSCSVAAPTAPTATDACDGAITGTTTTTFPVTTQGTTVVTWTYTDGEGNASTQTQNVIIDDITAPVPDIVSLSNLTGECSISLTAPTATDNCDGLITGTTTTSFPITTQGTTVVTWTYTDAEGNSSTQNQNVIVDDITAPTITCGGNITENPTATCNFTLVDYTGNTTTLTDNCGGTPTVTQSPVVGTVITGTTTITLTADDGNGNTSTCTFDVLLVDNTAPTMVCQDVTVYLDGAGNASITASDLDNGSTDNCGTVNFTATQTAFTCADLGAVPVTLTGADPTGNNATCPSTVTVIDTLVPVPDVASLPPLSAECSLTAVAPTATDNCGGSLTATTTDPLVYNTQGSFTITWTYTDASGNATTQSQSVVIDDITAPTITCGGNITENPNASCQFTLLDYTTNTSAISDNCVGTPTVTQSPVAGTVISGNTAITLTADDGNGNTSTCTFDVLLVDNTPPTMVCQDVTVYLDGAGNASITASDLDNGSTDNCGTVNFTATQTAFTCADLGAVPVTLTGTDPTGNNATCPSTVTVIDTLVPVPDVASLPALNAECSLTAVAPTATDNCGGSLTATTTDPLVYNTQGSFTITWTYTDASGNATVQTQSVIIDDISAPAITCGGDITENPTATCNFTLVDYTGNTTTLTDNCGGTPTVTQSPVVGTVITGTTTITLTADDGNGNTSTCTFDVLLVDNTAPTMVCQDVTVYLDGAGNASITASDLDNGSTDNCGTVNFTATQTAFTCADLGPVPVTLTGTDPTGNNATCPSTVTVIDTLVPVPDVASLPALTAECSLTAVAPTATDNCGGSLTATTTDPLVYNTQGSFTITWTYTDASGNATVQTQSVIIDDISAPAITCGGNITENPTATCNFTLVDYTGNTTTLTDNCGGTPTVTQSPVVGTVITGTTTITLTADDGNGNTSTCTFDVLLVDNTAPTMVCQDVTVYLDGAGNASITASDLDNGSTDNCGTVNFTATQTAFTCADLGAVPVTLTGTDPTGNNATCPSTVTVIDTLVPVPDVASLPPLSAECSLTAIAPTATDNCGGSLTATTTDPLVYNTQGSFTITWTYTDASGNATTQSQSVVIDDITAPTITCAGNITENPNASCQFTLLDYTTNTTALSDNCGGTPTVTQSPVVGTVISGNTAITLTADDGNGNTASCTFDVLLVDNTAPIMACQNINLYLDGTGNATIVADDLDNGSTDNCGTVTFTATQTAFTCADLGANTVTLTGTDATANASNCSATVTVIDTIAPTISCISDIISCDSIHNFNITGTDNCSTIFINQITGLTSGSTFPIGTTLNTFEILDGSGNRDTCFFTVERLPFMDASWTTLTPEACVNSSTIDLSTLVNGTIGGIFSGPGIVGNSFDPSLAGAGTHTINYHVENIACMDDSSQQIIVHDISTISAGIDDSICQLTYVLDASSNLPGVWSSLSGNVTFDNPSDTIAEVTATSYGIETLIWSINSPTTCVYSDTVIIQFDEQPIANAGFDTIIYQDFSTTLTAVPSSGVGYWEHTFGDGDIEDILDPNSVLMANQPGENELTWVEENGSCPAAYDDVLVTFKYLLIPEGISPNEDGFNDYFEIKGLEQFEQVSIIIFDRWGKLVFENSKYDNTWQGQHINGSNLTNDTYFYEVNVDSYKFKGFVVIRK